MLDDATPDFDFRPEKCADRIVGERLSKNWDQQVLIENRPGGGTNIANELVARSVPDGHTVLMGGSSQAATRGLYPSLSYDPIGAFAPVAFVCSYSFFMFVPKSLPVKSVSEFIAYGKANKGERRRWGKIPHRHLLLFIESNEIGRDGR